MRNELPETCFTVTPGEGKLILLKCGEKGYYPSDWETGSREKNEVIAEAHNRRCGINSAQVMAMKIGSAFGFDVPGANPQCYFDAATHIGTRSLKQDTTLTSSDGALCEHIQCRMSQYAVATVICSYISPISVPECMMGVQSDTILFLDLIQGNPLVPVVAEQTERGTWDLTLEQSAFSRQKEVNEGYQIIAKVHVGPVEYSLGERGGKFPSFFTWERTPSNDGDGPPNYYWGHYFNDRNEAIQDFCSRAEEKFEMLSKQRRPSVMKQLAAKPASIPRPDKTQKSHEER